MKIAISSTGTTLSSHVAPLPGPLTGFIVYDPDQSSYTVLGNVSGGEHCPQKEDGWVDIIADAGVDVLVVGGIALDVAHHLSRSGIRIYECISATVLEAIQALKLNLLRAMDSDCEVVGNWYTAED